MILLTIHYNEDMDRSKLTEQKNPFEYIVPPPTSGVGTIVNDNKDMYGPQVEIRNYSMMCN